jgi:cellulose synthase/poly-beta-1,6-N-acetylglucosamine synthase-like glycosyltransferase
MGQLHLTWIYLKAKKRKPAITPEFINFPTVTIQLPIYNEKYVVERLLDAVSLFDYPKEKLEIQVLDDSTDETTEIILKKIESMRPLGLNFKLIHREQRVGYKAGALDHGFHIASGEFIAIFDADFIPPPDFLNKTLPYFINEKVGVVQTRWGHINKDYSILTQLQAFGLDAHFSIEQTARSAAGSFINFNGTCGVWRKTCITDAGGWSNDTLTEDLDLSYRAQLRGWKFEYLEDVETKGELPVIMPAIKSQQYRWNKGAAETAKKNFGNVLRSSLSWKNNLAL